MNMKKVYKIYSNSAVSIGTSSCSDFLEKEVDLTLSEEQVFRSYENTRGFLANIYTYLPDAFVGYTDGQFRSASRDCMTDNAFRLVVSTVLWQCTYRWLFSY